MNAFIVCTSVVIAICMLLIWVASTYNKFQIFIIRINEAEANIDSVLRKRFDLLNKSIDIIKTNTKVKDEVLDLIVKLRSRKLSNFELDRKLYDGLKEFNKYKEEYPELKTNESFMKIDIALSESEVEIVAFRKYYNDIITDYNKLVKAFPSNIVALIFKFKDKLYFDGKDMSDDIIDDFKL
jgi:LemA protein